MLARGVYPPPSQFEAWFLSGAHTEKDVDTTIKAARAAMKAVDAVRGSSGYLTRTEVSGSAAGRGGRGGPFPAAA